MTNIMPKVQMPLMSATHVSIAPIVYSKTSFLGGPETNVTYPTSEGGKTIACRPQDAVGFAILAKHLSNGATPKLSLTTADLPALLQDIETKMSKSKFGVKSYRGDAGTSAQYLTMRNAVTDFTQKWSDGGENITTKELYDWYERLAANPY